MHEYLVGVAIKIGHDVFWQEFPCIHPYLRIPILIAGVIGHSTYGFWTSSNRFVDRSAAVAIARTANQLKYPNNEIEFLFSEDLGVI